jgi:hypothetical protein
MNIQAIKPEPKRIATSTGKTDQRQRDNKLTPGNTPVLQPSKSTKNRINHYYQHLKSYKSLMILNS